MIQRSESQKEVHKGGIGIFAYNNNERFYYEIKKCKGIKGNHCRK